MKPTEHLSITERPGTYIVVMSDSRGPTIVVNDGPGARAFRYTSEQAAKLALAVLEAAGMESAYHSAYNAGSDWQLEHAVNELSEYVRARSAYEAEARERAELEAEALELLNTWVDTQYYETYSSWAEVEEFRAKIWLAVARRAREMRNEKKVNTND